MVVCKLPTKVAIADESAEAGDDEEEEECEESSSADDGLTQQASVRHATAMALGRRSLTTATANNCKRLHTHPYCTTEQQRANLSKLRSQKHCTYILNRYLTMV